MPFQFQQKTALVEAAGAGMVVSDRVFSRIRLRYADKMRELRSQNAETALLFRGKKVIIQQSEAGPIGPVSGLAERIVGLSRSNSQSLE